MIAPRLLLALTACATSACSELALSLTAADDGYRISRSVGVAPGVCVSRPGLPPVCAGTIWSAEAEDIEGADLEWPGRDEPLELPAYVAESLGEMKLLFESWEPPFLMLMQDGRVRMLLDTIDRAEARYPPMTVPPEDLRPPVSLPVGGCNVWGDILEDIDDMWYVDSHEFVAVTSTGAHYVRRFRAASSEACGEPPDSHGFERRPERDGTYYPHGFTEGRRGPDGVYTYVDLADPKDASVPFDPPARSLMINGYYVATDGRVIGRLSRERRVSQHIRGLCALDENGRGFRVQPELDLPELDGALWVDECCGFFADGVVRCPASYERAARSIIELPLDL